jgi:hypothetical protein
VLGDAGNELGTLARLTLQRAQAQWHELGAHPGLVRRAHRPAHGRDKPAVRTAATLPGI